MATNYYLNGQGRLYSGSVALSTNDSQILFVGTVGAAAITSTPTTRQVIEDAVKQTALSNGTAYDPVQKKMH